MARTCGRSISTGASPTCSISRTKSPMAVVQALQAALSKPDEQRLEQKRTDNVAAYQEYLKGVALMPNRKVQDMRLAARQHFERAVELDAAFARATSPRRAPTRGSTNTPRSPRPSARAGSSTSIAPSSWRPNSERPTLRAPIRCSTPARRTRPKANFAAVSNCRPMMPPATTGHGESLCRPRPLRGKDCRCCRRPHCSTRCHR